MTSKGFKWKRGSNRLSKDRNDDSTDLDNDSSLQSLEYVKRRRKSKGSMNSEGFKYIYKIHISIFYFLDIYYALFIFMYK